MKSIAIVLCLVVTGAVAAADPFHIPQYTGVPLMISSNVVAQQTLNRELDRTTKPPSTAVRARTTTNIPAQMAKTLPAAARGNTETFYRGMLDHFPALAKQWGVPPDDVASAATMLVAGSYIAYHGVDIRPAHFQAVYGQVKRMIATNPTFAKASGAQRRELYERLAIMGMCMTIAPTQIGNDAKAAAALRRDARDYLQQFLQIDADRIRITSQGLVFLEENQ